MAVTDVAVERFALEKKFCVVQSFQKIGIFVARVQFSIWRLIDLDCLSWPRTNFKFSHSFVVIFFGILCFSSNSPFCAWTARIHGETNSMHVRWRKHDHLPDAFDLWHCCCPLFLSIAAEDDSRSAGCRCRECQTSTYNESYCWNPEYSSAAAFFPRQTVDMHRC